MVNSDDVGGRPTEGNLLGSFQRRSFWPQQLDPVTTLVHWDDLCVHLQPHPESPVGDAKSVKVGVNDTIRRDFLVSNNLAVDQNAWRKTHGLQKSTRTVWNQQFLLPDTGSLTRLKIVPGLSLMLKHRASCLSGSSIMKWGSPSTRVQNGMWCDYQNNMLYPQHI